MKVRVEGGYRNVRTLWMEGGIIKMIDQRKLPHRFEIKSTTNHSETAEAIRNMTVRGAGAIGVAAAYGMAQAAIGFEKLSVEDFEASLKAAAQELRRTRPTAMNLFRSIDRCLAAAGSGPVPDRVNRVLSETDRIAEEDLSASRRIGEIGSELIEDSFRLLTHCNAGALAFIDYGTALSPIRFANAHGKKIFVFVDETRPRCQGSMLTAWELQQEGIPYSIIVDNAGGYFMRRGEVDMVIVGADRIAANGDVVNKIGTYEKAVLARENGIPFYVAAPKMTFDLNCGSGDDVEIEERGSEEVLSIWGEDSDRALSRVLIAPRGAPARNPAFDVTPAKYVTDFITEVGILGPPFNESIRRAFGSGSV